MKKITLRGKTSLIEIEPKKYLLMPGKKEDLEYMRISYSSENPEDIFAIDLSSGPYLPIGYIVDGIPGAISKITIEENSLIYLEFNE
jgi:hypothetical protein